MNAETKQAKQQVAPYFVAAECDARCEDPMCPYTHIGHWAGGLGERLATSAEYDTARAALLKAGG